MDVLRRRVRMRRATEDPSAVVVATMWADVELVLLAAVPRPRQGRITSAGESARQGMGPPGRAVHSCSRSLSPFPTISKDAGTALVPAGLFVQCPNGCRAALADRGLIAHKIRCCRTWFFGYGLRLSGRWDRA